MKKWYGFAKATPAPSGFELPYPNGRPALGRGSFRIATIGFALRARVGTPSPARSLERRRGPRRLDDRIRNFSVARRHRRQASRSAAAARHLADGRTFRPLRRADSGG